MGKSDDLNPNALEKVDGSGNVNIPEEYRVKTFNSMRN